jgi:hypothetical protein
MNHIPDKDEVGRSNRLGPSYHNTPKTQDFPANLFDLPRREVRAANAANGGNEYRTKTARGVAMGIPVVCERCNQTYHVARLRPGRPHRRLCVGCRSLTGALKAHDSFVSPEGDKAARIRANGLINKRLRAGTIVKPTACEWCGKVARLDSHHPDYSQPDLIVWLCRSDHMKCHYNPEFERQVAQKAESTGEVQSRFSNVGTSGPKRPAADGGAA